MGVFVKSILPESAYRKEGIKEYGKKVKELKEEAVKLDENGLLLISFIEERDKYRTLAKAQEAIMDLPKLFPVRVLQNNPSLIEDYNEALTHLKKVIQITSRRRKSLNKNKKPNKGE